MSELTKTSLSRRDVYARLIESNEIHVIIYKTIHFRRLSRWDSTRGSASVCTRHFPLFPFHYPRCSLRCNTEALPRAKKMTREMRHSRKRGKRVERQARKAHVYVYMEERAGETGEGGERGYRTHRIRILCKRITSDYARLSANRITSLLFARRQAVDLVNSNSIPSRAGSPTERRFSERLFLSYT